MDALSAATHRFTSPYIISSSGSDCVNPLVPGLHVDIAMTDSPSTHGSGCDGPAGSRISGAAEQTTPLFSMSVDNWNPAYPSWHLNPAHSQEMFCPMGIGIDQHAISAVPIHLQMPMQASGQYHGMYRMAPTEEQAHFGDHHAEYGTEEARPKKRGRPLGSKDIVPRVRRFTRRAPKKPASERSSSGSTSGKTGAGAAIKKEAEDMGDHKVLPHAGTGAANEQTARKQRHGMAVTGAHLFPGARLCTAGNTVTSPVGLNQDARGTPKSACAIEPSFESACSSDSDSLQQERAGSSTGDEEHAPAEMFDSDWLALHHQLSHKRKSKE